MITIQDIQKIWVERANVLQLKGHKRTDACLHFLTGALAATYPDTTLSGQLKGNIFVVSVQGWKAFETHDFEKEAEPCHA